MRSQNKIQIRGKDLEKTSKISCKRILPKTWDRLSRGILPVARENSIRVIIALCTELVLAFYQMDVLKAYIN